MRRCAPIVMFLLCLWPALARAQTGTGWTSVRSENFLLVGDAPEREIRQVAARLELFRQAFTQLFAGARFDSPVPTTVIVFRDHEAYRPFKPLYRGRTQDVAGYFSAGQERNFITLTVERRAASAPYATIFHEYAHLFVNDNMRGAPLWYNEGLASYYSTFEAAPGASSALVGRPIPFYARLLRTQELLPFATFLAVDHNSPHYNEHDLSSIFYAQSWAFTHYLTHGAEGRRRPQLARFLELRAAGQSIERSFQEAFQTDYATMELELRHYLRRPFFPTATIRLSERLRLDANLASAPITEAAAQAHLGALLVHVQRLAEGEARLAHALALDPEAAPAHAALGMLRLRQRRFAQASAHLRRAAAAEPQNPLAHYYYAYALSREGMSEAGTVGGYAPEVAREMRAALARAIALAPDFTEAYRLLSVIHLVTGEQLEECAGLLRRALDAQPGREELAYALAQIYLRQGNFAGARQVLEPVANRSEDAARRAEARSLLSSINGIEEQADRFASGRNQFSSNAAAPEDARYAEALRSFRPRILRRFHGARLQGLLTDIECAGDGATITVQAGERTLRLRSDELSRITFVTYVALAGRVMTCGPREPANPVIVTFRPLRHPRAGITGEVVAVEFIPPEVDIEP